MIESALQKHLSKKSPSKGNMDEGYEYLIIKVADLLQRIDPASIKGERGNPGRNAPHIDENKLADRILKSIRIPTDGEHGHTPTNKELLSLIIPLIPKPIPGKSPDEEKIVSKVLSKIRVPKDGENGEDAKIPDLRELAINTINLIESLEGDDRINYKAIKGIRNYVMEVMRQGGPGVIMTDNTLTGSGVPGDPLSVKNPGGSTNFVDNEVIGGSGTSWTLAHVPVLGSEHIFAIGQRLIPSVDYTILGAIITTSLSWNAATLLADYRR